MDLTIMTTLCPVSTPGDPGMFSKNKVSTSSCQMDSYYRQNIQRAELETRGYTVYNFKTRQNWTEVSEVVSLVRKQWRTLLHLLGLFYLNFFPPRYPLLSVISLWNFGEPCLWLLYFSVCLSHCHKTPLKKPAIAFCLCELLLGGQRNGCRMSHPLDVPLLIHCWLWFYSSLSLFFSLMLWWLPLYRTEKSSRSKLSFVRIKSGKWSVRDLEAPVVFQRHRKGGYHHRSSCWVEYLYEISPHYQRERWHIWVSSLQ